MRFALRRATLDAAQGIAHAHTASWRTSYRGILPDSLLGRINIDQRASTWRRTLVDPAIFALVAYDVSHRDIVGLCDAGRSRRVAGAGEVYRMYLEHHARRH